MSLTVHIPEKYRGKYIAYKITKKGLDVKAVADDFYELLKKLEEKGIDKRFVMIEYVPEEDVIYIL